MKEKVMKVLVLEVFVDEGRKWEKDKDIETPTPVGDKIEIPVGGQTFGSGGFTIRRRLFVPPGHELTTQTSVRIPAEFIRLEESGFSVRKWYRVEIPSSLRGTRLLIEEYDLVGQPRYFYREVFHFT